MKYFFKTPTSNKLQLIAVRGREFGDFFFERFIGKKLCTACSRTSYKMFLLANLSKYLYNDVSEVKVNIDINNGSDKF